MGITLVLEVSNQVTAVTPGFGGQPVTPHRWLLQTKCIINIGHSSVDKVFNCSGKGIF